MSNDKQNLDLSEASQKIISLRQALSLSQEEFASRLGVSRIAAFYWESGRSLPSADTFVRMAKIAKKVDSELAVWFWQQIGVDQETLRGLVPEFNKSAKRAEKLARDAAECFEGDSVAVPLLRNFESVDAPYLATEEQILRWLTLPSFLVPNPSKTSCFIAPRQMTSLGVGGQDLLVVDSSKTDSDDLKSNLVIAQCKANRETYVGLLEQSDFEGKQVSFLKRADLVHMQHYGDYQIMNERSERETTCPPPLQVPNQIFFFSRRKDWQILGKVICRIGSEQWQDFGRKT